MIELREAKIFSNTRDEEAIAQINELLDTKLFDNTRIRFMSDYHKGAGCTIGTTIPITDKVIPNLVGVDIACGMLVIELGEIDIDLAKFDEAVRKAVPSGRNVGSRTSVAATIIKKLRCYKELNNLEWLESSLGTLGGGNHFIEIDHDKEGNKYLVIHSGSRNLGKQVAEIYQRRAIKHCRSIDYTEIVERLKKEGRQAEIQATLQQISATKPKLPNALCYIEGQDLEDYLHDMKVCTEFAYLNRQLIAQNIFKAASIRDKIVGEFTVLHNYIGPDNIIRKGAISAYKGEEVLIPLNMRDGCILGRGKGNPDWNYSAPHGAGRKMSRAQAKQELDVQDFKEVMQGIYSTTVGRETIDEAPAAYKPSEDIIEQIKDTVEIEKIIKPIYNFKAAE